MRMRGEYPSPIEQAASPETEAAFQSRLFTLLAAPGLKLRRIAALLDAESYLVEEKSRRGSVLRFDVERYAGDQRRTGRFAKLPNAYRPTLGVILPPGEGEIRSGEGKEPYREAEVIHRTKAVMDLLGGMNEPYDLVDGTTTPNMVRRLSYVAFVLKERGKLLMVNDEEGNATYVVHHLQGEEEAQEYLQSRKDDLRDLMQRNPGLVSVLEFRGGMEAYVEDLRDLIERPYAEEPAREEHVTQAPAGTKETLAGTEEETLMPALEGWATVHDITKTFGKSRSWIQRRLAQLNPVEGLDVGTYLDARGLRVVYYSPETVERLREMAQEYEPAPDGWMTTGGLSAFVGKSRDWSQQRLEELTPVEGRDARIYLDKARHQVVMHYSPRIVKQLQELAQEHEPAPDGWMTTKGLMKLTNKSKIWVQNRIKRLAPVTEEGVKTFFDASRHPFSYYSPRIVKQLQELAQEHEPAPEGWVTSRALWQVLKKSNKWVQTRLDQLHLIEGRDVGTYIDRAGHQVAHYSPAIVERLRELAQEHEPAPEGWVTAHSLMEILQKHEGWIQRRINKLNLVQDRDMGIYLDTANNPLVHYSPKIVERLKKMASL